MKVRSGLNVLRSGEVIVWCPTGSSFGRADEADSTIELSSDFRKMGLGLLKDCNLEIKESKRKWTEFMAIKNKLI